MILILAGTLESNQLVKNSLDSQENIRYTLYRGPTRPHWKNQIKMFNLMCMRRLMNQNGKLANLFLEMSKGCSDYGNQALEDLYHSVVVKDERLMERYESIVKEVEPKHVVTETIATRQIETLIKMYGWQHFTEGFVLYAKNKEATLQRIGLRDAAKIWEKVANIAANLPKKPQF